MTSRWRRAKHEEGMKQRNARARKGELIMRFLLAAAQVVRAMWRIMPAPSPAEAQLAGLVNKGGGTPA